MEDDERYALIDYAKAYFKDCIPYDTDDYDRQLQSFAEAYADDILNPNSDINRTLMSDENVLIELPFEENKEEIPY